MSGRWWRAYGRARHDPKLLKLSDKQFRWWFNLVCVASDNDGVLPCHADLAVEFRVTGATMTKALDELIAAGLFDHDEAGIRPHNWNGLQYKSDTNGGGNGSTERVQRYRDKRKALGLPALGDYTKFKPSLVTRDGSLCVYCEATDLPLVVDHMVPIALGGTDAQDNLALACKPCNSSKAGRTPELAKMTIRVTTAAAALARYRVSTAGVTVTETLSENREQIQSSEANASGGQPPAKDVIFSVGLPWLMRRTGKSRDDAARIVGKWCSAYGDDAVLAAMQLTEQQNPVDPVSAIAAKFKPREERETWNQRRIREGMEAIRDDRH